MAQSANSSENLGDDPSNPSGENSTWARVVFSPWARLGMALAAVLGAVGGQYLVHRGFPVPGLIAYGGALLLTVQAGLAQATVHMAEQASPHTVGDGPPPANSHSAAAQAAWRRGSIRLIVVLIGACACAVSSWLLFDFSRPSHAAWAWYIAGLALLGIAALAEGEYTFPRSILQASRARWQAASVLGVLLLLGGGVRLWALDTLPFGTWYDEAANGLEALRMVNEPNFRPVYNDGVNASGHYLGLVALFFELFGANTYAIRLISALMGVGLVGAGFWLGRAWFGLWGGLVFGGFLAVARWSINFSRLGMYNITTPFLAVTALYFLHAGCQSKRLRNFILAGVALGFGVLFYSAYYLFLPVAGVIAVYGLLRNPQARRKLLLGYAVTLLAAGVVLAPTLKFATERPEQYFGRVRTTSILASTGPEERAEAVLRNTVRHLGMFHVWGDPNGRHNLPGRPMLDAVAGGLMVLGVAICCLRPRWWIGHVTLLWLVMGLVGGILSLDFESPQSLRAIGALPPAYLLATFPLIGVVSLAGQAAFALSVRRWRVSGKAIAVTVVLTLLATSAWSDIRTYFVVQARDFAVWNAHSTAETLAAQVLAQTSGVAEGTTQPYVISLFDGHPTLRFLVPQVMPVARLATTESLPLVMPPEKDMLLIFDAERRFMFEDAQALYPNARFEAWQQPQGGPTVLYTVLIPVADQIAIQGGRQTIGWRPAEDASVSGPPRMQTQLSSLAMWPRAESLQAIIPAEASESWIEWHSLLAVPGYGPYLFHVESVQPAAVWIGEELVANTQTAHAESKGQAGWPPESAIVLAEGMHPLRVRAELHMGVAQTELPGTDTPLQIYWRPPDRDWEQIPAWHFYHTPTHGHGLLGRYFANGTWAEPEAFAQIDTRWDMYFHVIPLPRPYTVEWTGFLRAPLAGEYALALQARDAATLWLDGTQIAESADGLQSAVWRGNLGPGDYGVRIRFADRTDHSSLRLLWEPPGGGGLRPVPGGFLLPPTDAYVRTAVDFVAPLLLGEGEDSADSVRMSQESMPDTVLRVEPQVIVAGLNQPTGLVQAAGLLWVTEPRAQRVRAYDADGTMRLSLTRGLTGPLREPSALGVLHGAGRPDEPGAILLVLDAETGIIHRFRAHDGTPLDPLPLPVDMAQRSRGIFVSDADEIWIAATSRGELIRLDARGNVLSIVPMRTGGDLWSGSQPVAVVQLDSGNLLAADGGLHKLVAFDSGGRRRIAWDIPAANTFAGTHLARDGAGVIFRSVPERGLVIAHAPNGMPLRAWDLRGPTLPAAHPVGLALDESGRLWIADSYAGMLIRFAPELVAESAPEEPVENSRQSGSE